LLLHPEWIIMLPLRLAAWLPAYFEFVAQRVFGRIESEFIRVVTPDHTAPQPTTAPAQQPYLLCVFAAIAAFAWCRP
jgi:hypothetical protein